MSGNEAIDQPLTGFGYSYWFNCTRCGDRVEVEADLFELQANGRADYSLCGVCGTVVDVGQQSPTLRDPEDSALQNDCVAQLVWHHSSRYENWPDVQAYTADVTAEARRTAEALSMFDADQRIAMKLSLAVHLGTYEATIENILRRLEDQDRADFFATRYWLHRVEIALPGPGDLHPAVIEEFHTMFGDVELAALHALGARAARYINLYEAIGSVSMAIAPTLIATVSTIAVPVAEAALAETAAAAAATAKMLAAPQSDGDSGPEWAEFVDVLQVEYLTDVNPQVRESVLAAVGDDGDAAEFHRRVRILAGLLKRPDVVINQLAAAPRRRLSTE